jgi:hypothetical protein
MRKLTQRQVHLDFHTSERIDGIGKMFNKEQFIRCLKKGHVSSITVFAKCHHGWAYFPSEANKMHPGLHFDLLSAELEACKEAGVQSPIYISAGFDEKYFFDHPDHMCIYEKDGKPVEIIEKNGIKQIARGEAGYHELCMNSPYLDVLKKQVQEVVFKFDPIGIFLDIVGERVCYCKHCKAQAQKLGMDLDNPETFVELGKITFKKYYETVNSAAREIKPDIRIFHNSGHISAGRHDKAHANTHLELESLPTGGWGYDHFPKSARYASTLGMEYLGMTGKFHLSWGEFGGFKHPNALRYEVALSLANGAKCSVGDQMHPYGFLDDATYELIGQAYAEAEKVEEYCYGIDAVADVALLSVEALTLGANGVYGSGPIADVGACRMLLEGKYLFDVIDTDADFSRYKVIILPDISIDGMAVVSKLQGYVKAGGKVLCTGNAAGINNMHFDLGVKVTGQSEFKPSYYYPSYNAIGLTSSNYVMYSQMYNTELTDKNAKVYGYTRNTFFNRAPEHFCSHQHTPFVMENNAPAVVIGKDGGYIAYDIFTEYAEVGSYILKETVHKTLDAILCDDKTLKTNLASGGVVTFNKQIDKNRDVLHMLYAIPTKRGKGVEIIEDIMPVYNTSFEIKTAPVKSVTLVPQNKEIPFVYENGTLTFTVPEFECSQIAVIEH